MPSKSKKQHNFMEAIAHNPAFAKKAGVSQKVGQEYSKADKGKTFRKGGIMGLFKGKETYKEELAEGNAIKSGKVSPEQYAKAEGKEKVKKFAMGGYMGGATLPNQQFPMQQQAPQNTMLNAPQPPGTPSLPYAANNQTAFKKGGSVKKMAMGGAPMMPPQAPVDPRMMAKKKAPRGVAPKPTGMMPPRPPMAAPQVAPTAPMKKGGKVKGQSPIQRQAKGGAKIVKMAKGGMTRGDGCCIRGKTRA